MLEHMELLAQKHLEARFLWVDAENACVPCLPTAAEHALKRRRSRIATRDSPTHQRAHANASVCTWVPRAGPSSRTA